MSSLIRVDVLELVDRYRSLVEERNVYVDDVRKAELQNELNDIDNELDLILQGYNGRKK